MDTGMTDQNQQERWRRKQTAPEDIIAGRETAPPAVVEPPADVTYELFLATLNSETRELLPDADLRKIYSEAMARALEERRQKRRAAAAEIAASTARIAAGLVPAEQQEAMNLLRRNSELVNFRVELPPAGNNGEAPDIGLRIDGRIYLDGQNYQLTRAQYDSYREIIYRVGDMELLFRGQNAKQRRWLMSRATGSVDPHVGASR